MTSPAFPRRAGSLLLATAYLCQLSVIAPAEPGGGGGGTPTYPDGTIRRAAAPIELPGGGSVTDGGGARYDLPLWVPDGPQGMQPSLGITYAGRGNGALGVGFHLAGLSMISPCGKSIASEGYADNVDLTVGSLLEAGHVDSSLDSYCLDGEKLVPHGDADFVVPPSGYSTQYATEIESFQKIVAHTMSSTALQPDDFTVHDPSGGRRIYKPIFGHLLTGAEDERSKLVASTISTAVFYPIAEAIDLNGNRIVYTYEDADSLDDTEMSFRLSRIDYAFLDPSHPRRSIKLDYQTRPDPIVRFINGIKIVNRSLLTSLTVTAPNPTALTKVMTYQLDYTVSPETERSLLHSVKMCDQFGSCSFVRSFTYTERDHGSLDYIMAAGDPEFGAYALSYDQEDLDAYNGNPDANWLPATDVRILLYDIDGDGDDDALYRTGRSRVAAVFDVEGESGTLLSHKWKRHADGQIRVRLSTEDQPVTWLSYDVSEMLEPHFVESLDDGDSAAYANLGASRVADFNRDGRLDLMLARTRLVKSGEVPDPQDPTFTLEDSWQYGFKTYYGRDFDHLADYPFPADITQIDDSLDISLIHGPILRYDLYGGALTLAKPPFQRVVADLDGDAVPEVLDAVDGDLDSLAQPTGVPVDWGDPYSYNKAGTFNYHTTLSTDGSAVEFPQNWTCGNGLAQVTDQDGDGRQDVLVNADLLSEDPHSDPITGEPTYRRLALSDPLGGTTVHGPSAVGDTSTLFGGGCDGPMPDMVMGDWNGDGLEDVLYPPHSYGDFPDPMVRFNLGGAYGPLEPMPVTGGAGMAELMVQAVPDGKLHHPVPWDRGTRVADVDGDGRADLVAFRTDIGSCVDPVVNAPSAPPTWSCKTTLSVFRSHGDHFAGEELRTFAQGGVSLAQGFTLSQVGDVNGDGAVDAVTVDAGRVTVTPLPWRSQPDMLDQVHDTGAAYPVEAFVYTRSWWGDEPRREATDADGWGPAPCAWPIACPRRGAPVVRQRSEFAGTNPDGTAMWRNTYHKYKDPRVSMLGRGSLGFARHEIWDRERGQWTSRRFDNQTPDDPDQTTMGGLFYPLAGRVAAESVVTPRSATPTAAELADYYKVAPGMSDSTVIDVVDRTSNTNYELRSASSGRVLTVLAKQNVIVDAESTAAASITTHTPEYVAILPGNARRTATSTDYDVWGNPINVTTELGRDGSPPLVTRTHNVTYEYRVGTWQLGLPARTVDRSFDADDPYKPARVVRTTYDAIGNSATVELTALSDPAPLCPPGDPSACEVKSTFTTVTSRDGHGNPTSTTTSAFDVGTPRTTQTTWDLDGVYPVTSTDALGFPTTVLFHPAYGVPIVTTDENSVTGTAVYDGFGRMISASKPGTATLTRTYAEVTGLRRGLKVTDSRQDGSRSYEVRDELGRSIDTALLGFGGQWTYGHAVYDVYGNQAALARPELTATPLVWTTSSFDRIGQVLETTTPDGATTVVDHSLDETTTWDPDAHESYVDRDRAGRIIESGHRLSDGTTYGAMKFEYAPFDQIGRVIDAEDHKLSLTYDAFGRLTQEDDPDTGVTIARYDGFGERSYLERATGDVYTDTFDALGRSIFAVGPDGATVTAYDAAAGAKRRPIEVVSPDGVITDLRYDSLGRVHQLDQTVDSTTRSVVHRYDSYGRPLYLFYPSVTGFDRFAVGYTYDIATGFLATVRDVSACHYSTTQDATDPACTSPVLWQPTQRDARGDLTRAKFGNGVFVYRTFDANTGRQKALSAAGQNTNYFYDDDGLLIRREDPTTQRHDDFTYDELHRLTGWSLTGPKNPHGPQPVTETEYHYDELGNLTGVETDGAPTYGATYGIAGGRPHVLASNTQGAYTHDDSGRQLTGPGRQITWSQFDLPSSITSSTNTREFRYDGTGGRVTRQDPASKVLYVGRLYEHRESTATGVGDTFLVYGEPGLVAQVDYNTSGKVTRYVVGDPLDSATLILRSSGAIDERTNFDPWGGRIDDDGHPTADPSPSTTFGFTGHEEDGAGLINMQGRIYDRAQYRFLSPDAVVPGPLDGQAYNPYSYVLNNPTNLTDPSGFEPDQDEPYEELPGEETYPSIEVEGKVGGETYVELSEVFISAPVPAPRASDAPAPTASTPATATPRRAAAPPNVVKGDPWQMPQYARMALEGGLRLVFSKETSFSSKAMAVAAIVVTGTDPVVRETATNALIAIPQGPGLSFTAYEDYHQRALWDEAHGHDEAATDDWLGMAQEGFLGVGETASMAMIFLPEASAPELVVEETTELGSLLDIEVTPEAAADFVEVTVSRSRYPEAAAHIEEAQQAGHPSVLTIDRLGAASRRRESLRGIDTVRGLDRDEYPPAMFGEGGFGASVRLIDPSHNRGAGSSVGNQLRGVPDGTRVLLRVIQ